MEEKPIVVGRVDSIRDDNHLHHSVFENTDRRPSVSYCRDMTEEVYCVVGFCCKNRHGIVDLADDKVDHRNRMLVPDPTVENCKAAAAAVDMDSRIVMEGHSVLVDWKDQTSDRIVPKALGAIGDHCLEPCAERLDHESSAYCSLPQPTHSPFATENLSRTAVKAAAD